MKKYFSFFKIRVNTEIQYRAAAWAGVATQLFFGFIQIMIYLAFYSNAKEVPIHFDQLITLVWLQQAFYSIIVYRDLDNDIIDMITNGNISYELIKPFNLYFMWFIKITSRKGARFLIRSFPILILAIFLQKPYHLSLPYSFSTFLLFLISMLLGTILVISIVTIIHILTFFTINTKGVLNIISTMAEFLSGFMIPIPLMPTFFQKAIYYLPFRYVGDLPFRIYSGNIVGNEVPLSIVIQIIYIFIFIVLGNFLMKKALTKVVVQGG